VINIEIDESGEGVEVFCDSEGVEELINYLRYIKANQEHMHLLAGGELGELLVKEKNSLVKHAKLIYQND